MTKQKPQVHSRAGLKLFGLLAALGLMIMAAVAPAANSIRFLREDIGRSDVTATDDRLVATRIFWDDVDQPVQMYVVRDFLSQEIIPFAQNLNGITNNEILFGLQKALEEWNDAGSDFEYREFPLYADQGPLPPNQIFAPTGLDLDRLNLITWQDNENVLPAPILAATFLFYFNQDIDLTDPNSFPANVIEINFTDIGIDLDQDNLVDLEIPRRFYRAGTIIDGDILFSQIVGNWAQAPDNPDDLTPQQRQELLGSLDIQGIALHELGHEVGLGHPPLLRPTMTAVLDEDRDPYDMRDLDFDDELSINQHYSPYFSRLGRSAIAGRLINGDAVDGVDEGGEFPIAEVELAPVYLGRVNNDGFTDPDDVIGVDQDTTFTNKVRLFATVLTSPRFEVPVGINSRVRRDSRYFFGGLPPSSSALTVNDSLTLSPDDYILYIQPTIGGSNDEAELAFGPAADQTPPEFYGGAVPYFQPGTAPQADANVPGDLLVQDNFLQFGYSALGQFSLRLAASNFQLVDDLIVPTESYLTYRITDPSTNQTTDVPNFRTQNIEVLRAMTEDDLNNVARGTYRIAQGIISTQTIELADVRNDGQEPGTAMVVKVDMTNITAGPLEVGLRYLVRPIANNNNQILYFQGNTVYEKEITLEGAFIPDYLNFAPDFFPQTSGVMILKNAPGIPTPDRVQLANYYNINQIGAPPPGVFYDYQTNAFELEDGAYAVYFDPVVLAPGETRSVATAVTYASNLTNTDDGPFPFTSSDVPGGDNPTIYKKIPLGTNEIAGGLDILTNTGQPGGLQAAPGSDDDGGNGGGPDGPDDTTDDGTDFDDDSPNGGGNIIPNTQLYIYGADFGDLNNDGFPDLMTANGAIVSGAPESLVNRVYINIPAPTNEEPGGRRLIDLTFGQNGIPGDADDRMPYLLDGSSDVKLADFDNDGDLDAYISNFATPGSTVLGAQNRFYENVDVDDPSVNPSPDTDSFGDGFFVDVTATWDPGILNTGAFTAYPNTFPTGTYGGIGQGFDISSKSDVGDFDSDGDIDIVVGNQNAFADLLLSAGTIPTDSGPQILQDGLRFSERILINHTLEPPISPFLDPPGRVTRFADETLGADGVFGFELDRLPALMPEWELVSPTDAFGEIELSNTMEVRVGNTRAWNSLGFVAFDKRNGGIAGIQLALNEFDGDDQVYVNFDVDADGRHDGYFQVMNYGVEPWLLADDGSTVRFGIPDGYSGDAQAPEDDRKVPNPDQTVAGLIVDTEFTGWNELIAFNAGSDDVVNIVCNRRYSGGGFTEYNRGRTAFFADLRTFIGQDYFPAGGLNAPTDIRETVNIPKFGRPRGAATADFDLDGLPDFFVANDGNSDSADIVQTNVPPGFPALHLNEDFDVFTNLSSGIGNTSSAVLNGTPNTAICVAAADIDLDGDIDVFTGSAGNVANFYKNNRRVAGVGVTSPGGLIPTNPDSDDQPMFFDATYSLLGPYYGGGADIADPQGSLNSNITLGADLADFDRDGDLDLVFANGGLDSTVGDYQMVYKNTGPSLNDGTRVFSPAAEPYGSRVLVSEFANLPWLTDDPYTATDVKFTDIDGDGAFDILFGAAGAQPRIFINVDSNDPFANSQPDADLIPDGIFDEQSERIPNFTDPRKRSTRKIAVGDLDGDGRSDIVLANGVQNEGAPNVLLMNRARPGFPTQFGWFQDETTTRVPIVTYVDNDNNPVGSGPVLDDTTDVAIVDVDNDGDNDLVFANRLQTDILFRPNFYQFSRLLLNNGSGVFTEQTNPLSWPLVTVAFDAQKIIVGDFRNQGEKTEDINGNGILDGTEDLNNNGFLDFEDTKAANGSHDATYDIVITAGDIVASGGGDFNRLYYLRNRDDDSNGFGDGAFSEDGQVRFDLDEVPRFPVYGGDAGDVNKDGYIDLVLALDTQTTQTGGTSSSLTSKIPAQLLMNVSLGGGTGAGFFVDASDNGEDQPLGELPVLKTQIGQGQFADFAGRSLAVKLADVDRDGDLDIILTQAGRGGVLPSAGFANNVLLNLTNPSNFNSRDVLSTRDYGGPILNSLSPPAGSQGQKMVVIIQGRNLSTYGAVDFGAGVTVVDKLAMSTAEKMYVRIEIAPSATVGPRVVKITNPDGQFGYSAAGAFQVLPEGVVPPSQADAAWRDIE